jgi:cyclopropane fatty-acyl-phospholipid synthase-like methyltransferase
MTALAQQHLPQLAGAWDEVAAELNAIPLELEQVRYAAVLKFIASLPRESRILEAGCGAGRILRTLAAMGFENLVGLEISQARLDYVLRAGPSCAELVCNDQVEFQSESFDAVVSAAVIEHVTDPAAWLGELARVTKRGGLISIATDTYMWHWLKRLGLYRTVQPIDQAIWPATLIRWGEGAGLEVVACGGFVNVADQRWYLAKQLKRLTSLRRWWCKLWGIRRAMSRVDEMPAPSVDETAAILRAVRDFPLASGRNIANCVWSYECFYWFKKR